MSFLALVLIRDQRLFETRCLKVMVWYMDDDNYERLIKASPGQFHHKVKYFLDYAPHLGTKEVPDPYYGGKYGFETVLDMVEEASVGFLDFLKKSGEIV